MSEIPFNLFFEIEMVIPLEIGLSSPVRKDSTKATTWSG